MIELPKGWVLSLLSDTVVNPKDDIVDGPFGSNLKASEYKSQGIPIIRLQNVARNEFIEKNINYVTIEKADFLKRHSFIAGDIAVTKLGEPLGKAAIIPEMLEKGIIVADIVRIRLDPNFIDKRYLCYMINSPVVCKEFEKHTKGTTRQRVNLGHIRGLHIPIAPLNEQKRIAEKLDQILAEVNSAKARLDQIPGILKALRSSILIKAISGDLTANWRRKNGVKLSDWKNTTFKDLCDDITVGFVGKMVDQYTDIGIPFLRSQNVRPFKYDSNGLKFVSKEFHHKISKSTLRPGDVVVVRSGAPGQCCVIPEELKEANCSDLVILRPTERLLSDYACIYINSETSQSYVRSNQVGVAQQHFNVGSMKKTPIKLPSTEEQKEIISIVHQLYELVDQIEAQYNRAMEQVDKITQSVLAKAFRGELVPQNPNDEPASVLLERIKAEKEFRELTPRQISRKTARKKQEVKEMILSVLETLKKEKKPLSAQGLLQKAGYPVDSDPEKIEEFFLDIRNALRKGSIIRERVKDEDIFRLAA